VFINPLLFAPPPSIEATRSVLGHKAYYVIYDTFAAMSTGLLLRTRNTLIHGLPPAALEGRYNRNLWI